MPTDPRTWAWDCRGLTPAQRLTLFALSDQADVAAGTCQISLSALAEQTELSRRGVIKALDELDGRFIDRERGGPGRRTCYRLRWENAVARWSAQPINPASGDALDEGLSFSPGSNSVASRQDALQVPPLTASDRLGPQSPTSPVSITPNHSAAAFEVMAVELPTPVQAETPTALNLKLTVGASRTCSESEEPPALTQGHGILPNAISSLQDQDASVLSETTPPPRQTAQPIPHDWTPTARVYAWAEKQGLTKDWVEAQVDEFVLYWTDTGERRKSWDATFINRLTWLNLHQYQASPSRLHPDERIQHTGLADKDYARDATPLEDIPWMRPTAVG